MFKIFKKKDKNNKEKDNQHLTEVEANEVSLTNSATIENEITHQESQESISNQSVETPTPAPKVRQVAGKKLDQQLEKSRNGFGKQVKNLFSVKKTIDDSLFEDIETSLLMADVGAKATMDIVDKTSNSVKRKNLNDTQEVYFALMTHLMDLAKTVEQPLIIDTTKKPYVILVVGVNGVGKTTTIAKIARNFKQQGKSVMLAAGDTFRAAAVEQYKPWGAREDIPVVAQTTGSDSASVFFDAMSSAKAKNIDILIADTAGRLHTQSNLMQELGKISRVMRKNDETAPHETLIVVDGGTGQNAISQIQEFNKTTKLTGIAITKLDGTAKGGVLFNLAKEFGIPVRFIGVGEKSSDLKPFIAREFVEALLG
jgi:fused signal recognition particle receptor